MQNSMDDATVRSFQDKKNDCVIRLFVEDGLFYEMMKDLPESEQPGFMKTLVNDPAVQEAVTGFLSTIKARCQSALPVATPAPHDPVGAELMMSSPTPVPPLPAENGGTCFTVSANGKANEPYRAKVRGSNKAGKDVVIRQLEVPSDLGLAFDPSNSELYGIPSRAGEFEFPVHFSFACCGSPLLAGVCQVIINPDPKTLWKTLASDQSDIYWKQDADSLFMQGQDGLAMLTASKRGRSHAHVGSFRDDDALAVHDPTTGWRILAVADGAGSARNSRKGSQIAVTFSGKTTALALQGEKGITLENAIAALQAEPAKAQRPVMEELYYLFGNAARSAVREISAEAAKTGSGFKDYLSTLIIVIHKRFTSGHFVGAYWVGDGGVGIYHKGGELFVLGRADSGEFAGQTRFLDPAMLEPAEIMNRIRFKLVTDFTAVIAMTDGITDPKFETDANFEDNGHWHALWSELAPITASREPDRELLDWLDFWSPGNHDDRTIALLYPRAPGNDDHPGSRTITGAADKDSDE